jgi:hypothetical protein
MSCRSPYRMDETPLYQIQQAAFAAWRIGQKMVKN